MTEPGGLSLVGRVPFTCVTAQANPTADVLWYKNTVLIDIGIVHDIFITNAVFKQRRSNFTFTAAKSDNQAMIRCAVDGNTDVFQESKLGIKCMFNIILC